MINFEDACEIAYGYYADYGFYGLQSASDLGDMYSFMGYSKTVTYGGIVPITVSKQTGEIGGFPFYSEEFLLKLNGSKQLDIPGKYRPKIT